MNQFLYFAAVHTVKHTVNGATCAGTLTCTLDHLAQSVQSAQGLGGTIVFKKNGQLEYSINPTNDVLTNAAGTIVSTTHITVSANAGKILVTL